MPFRESIINIAPPWLQKGTGLALLTSIGTVIDALGDWQRWGVRASLPTTAPPDALHLIGNDRQIDRGPNEPAPGYAVRLQRAFDTWKGAGGAATMLQQLLAYYTGGTLPTAMRAVSDSSVWHELDMVTGDVTRTKVTPRNWIWDAFTGTRWWRGWVIIDSTGGPYALKRWGDGHTYGDGTTWGSTATAEEAASIRKIVSKWKPANVTARVIIAFSSTIFRRTDTAPPNPNGNYDVDANRDPNAIYWSEQT